MSIARIQPAVRAVRCLMVVAGMCLGALPAGARAAEPAPNPSPLSIDLGAAYRQPEQPPPGVSPDRGGTAAALPPPPAAGRETRFGYAGSRWWSLGGAIANNFDEATDVNAHAIYSVFFADTLEFGVEVGSWYFSQPGDDTGGVSGSMLFRWHFWHWGGAWRDEGFAHTFFADAGIGLLGAFDNVPDGGTSFDFMPRAGAGFTTALDDSESGPRLTVGLRWHHISNARINGDDHNPARDGLLGYVEVQWPF